MREVVKREIEEQDGKTVYRVKLFDYKVGYVILTTLLCQNQNEQEMGIFYQTIEYDECRYHLSEIFL